jgi:2-polyprenyl-6-methoxyphenol hydroxylase-like FAD-dependent oxidoreductase
MTHVVVIGGSQAGLMAALAASRAGATVTVMERSADSGRTGAMIQIGDSVLEQLTGRHDVPRFEGTRIQTWRAVYDHLLSAVVIDPDITLMEGAEVVDIGQTEAGVWAAAKDGRVVEGDVLVGADGYRSLVRRFVAPGRPDAAFSGYVLWSGLSKESALPPGMPWVRGEHVESHGSLIMVGSILPAEDGSERRGDRRAGIALYDSGHNDVLRRQGSVEGRVARRTLFPADIPDQTYEELGRSARYWSDPWRSTLIDCVQRRSLIGTPVAEYLPERLVDGRMCLVGDAAHVPSPWMGYGFKASMLDAQALGAALKANGDDVAAAVEAYGRARLRESQQLVQRSQQFSRSFGQG